MQKRIGVLNLTPEQRSASENQLPLSRVLSGAGTGKTTVISHRINWLIDDCGVPPQNIMAITFTRKAGRQLQERVGVPGVVTGTFHAILSRHLSLNILDEDEEEELLDRVGASLGLCVSGKWRKHSRKHYQKGIKAFREGKSDGDTFTNTYLSLLSIQGDTDYDGILYGGLSLIKEGVFDHVSHLIVDEAQDNECLQWELLKAFSENGTKVMVVGDVAQGIYGWRGADPDVLGSLDWPTFPLTQTFRCPRHVTELVNGLPIEGAVPLRTNKGEGARQVLVGSDIGEALKVVDTPNDKVAIICRYNDTVSQVKGMLSSMGYPLSEDVSERGPRGPIWSLIKWMAKPHSKSAKEGALKKLEGTSIDSFRRWASMETGGHLLENWLDSNGSRKIIDVLPPPTPETAQEHNYYMEEYSHHDIFDVVCEEQGEDLTVDGTTGITVGTIHSLKGLEFEGVILPDLSDWPRGKVKGEDYRLFYVGATRSSRNLVCMANGEGGIYGCVKERL